MAAFRPDNLSGKVAIPSQMVVGSLTHFALTFQNASNSAVNAGGSDLVKETLMRLFGTKGTPVIIGTFENTGSTLRVAFENTCGWTASDLDTALKALGTVDSIDLSGSDAVAFTY